MLPSPLLWKAVRPRGNAPEVAAEAMRTYAEEMNRLNRERRLSVDSDRRALTDVERKIKDVVAVIKNGGCKPALLDRLNELELQRGRLRERLAQVSATPPDVHPNVSELFRAKVARLTEALNDPADRNQAARALRSLTLAGPRLGRDESDAERRVGNDPGVGGATDHEHRENESAGCADLGGRGGSI
jgi:hypothetical protein